MRWDFENLICSIAIHLLIFLFDSTFDSNQFMEKLPIFDDSLASSLQLRIQTDIDAIFLIIEKQNGEKRENHFVSYIK